MLIIALIKYTQSMFCIKIWREPYITTTRFSRSRFYIIWYLRLHVALCDPVTLKCHIQRNGFYCNHGSLWTWKITTIKRYYATLLYYNIGLVLQISPSWMKICIGLTAKIWRTAQLLLRTFATGFLKETLQSL